MPNVSHLQVAHQMKLKQNVLIVIAIAILNSPSYNFNRMKSNPSTTGEKKKELSNCCGAEVATISHNEGTCYYECHKCHKACDIRHPIPDKEKKVRLTIKEQYFVHTMQMMAEEYAYACQIEGRDLTFHEFTNWINKNYV